MGSFPTFRIVPTRGAFDVLGMRSEGRTLADAKRPGDPGWLGNPYVASDAGGSYTRQEATELFWRDLQQKVESDPGWRQAVLDLRGKAVGYYKPGEEHIHLHPLQQWLSDQPVGRVIRNGIIEQLEPSDVFVFGSNLKGIHGAGAAKTARQRFGAIPGQGEGLMGQSYALPTKAAPYQGREPAAISASFQKLYDTAKANPDRTFYLTRVGQGLAGHDEAGIRALMGEKIPANVRPWWDWEKPQEPPATPATKQLELLEDVDPPVADGPAAGEPATQQLAGKRWPLILAVAAGLGTAGAAGWALTDQP